MRLLAVVRKVLEAGVAASGGAGSGKVWANLARSKAERDKASHASRCRKVLHVHAKHLIQAVETEYRAGTMYFGQEILCSATLPPPKGQAVVEGRSPGAWVNVDQLAIAMSKPVDEVKPLVEEIYQE